MKLSAELVTVYIPTHRRPDMAIRAVKSVLRQDYPSLEIIVCDDGTPIDQTFELQALLKNVGAMYLRNESAMGACHARNKAISQAKGVFVTGLDDDDEFAEGRIGELVSEYNQSIAFVAASYKVISSAGVSISTFDSGYVNHDQLLHYNKIGNQVLTETSRMLNLGGFDESFPAMQDYEMWIRLCKHYGKGKKIKSPSYILHKEHEENRISSQPEKLLMALKLMQAKHSGDLKPRHKKTHELLAKRLRLDRVPLLSALKVIHKDNYRMVLAPYLNS